MNYFEYQEMKWLKSKPIYKEEDVVEFPPIFVSETELSEDLKTFFNNQRALNSP